MIGKGRAGPLDRSPGRAEMLHHCGWAAVVRSSWSPIAHGRTAAADRPGAGAAARSPACPVRQARSRLQRLIAGQLGLECPLPDGLCHAARGSAVEPAGDHHLRHQAVADAAIDQGNLLGQGAIFAGRDGRQPTDPPIGGKRHAQAGAGRNPMARPRIMRPPGPAGPLARSAASRSGPPAARAESPHRQLGVLDPIGAHRAGYKSAPAAAAVRLAVIQRGPARPSASVVRIIRGGAASNASRCRPRRPWRASWPSRHWPCAVADRAR